MSDTILEESSEIRNWDDMDLKHELLRGIYAYGFEIPSEIQKKAIIPITKGNDVIAQAQSGSGKTGSFSIGILQRINLSLKKTQRTTKTVILIRLMFQPLH